jgi:hypothetical protein
MRHQVIAAAAASFLASTGRQPSEPATLGDVAGIAGRLELLEAPAEISSTSSSSTSADEISAERAPDLTGPLVADVEELRARVAALEELVAELGAQVTTLQTSAAGRTLEKARKPAARKSTAKKAAAAK